MASTPYIQAQRVDPLKKADGTGVLGRISDDLTKQGLHVGAYGIDVNAISLLGQPGISSAPFILSRGGVTQFNYDKSSDTMENLITSLNEDTAHDSGVFSELWSSRLLKSVADNQVNTSMQYALLCYLMYYVESITKLLLFFQVVYNTLGDKETEITFPSSGLGRQLEMVAKMIDSRSVRGTDADVFFLQTGGWDTHSDVLDRMNSLFNDVDASFKAFSEEMKAKGKWDSVTVIETSDFARTLNPNTGRGSDHGW